MRKINYLAAGTMLLALVSCSKSGGSLNDKVDGFPVKESSSDKWGFIDRNGEFVFENEFENEPSVAYNGYFTVQENDGISVYKFGSKPELLPDCEGLVSAGIMEDGVMPVVRKGSRISLIDTKGATVATLEPVKGKEIVTSARMFQDGLLQIKDEDGRCGYVDKKGQVVIDLKYDEVGLFSEGLAVVSKNRDDGGTSYSIINKKGEEVGSIKDNLRLETGVFEKGYLVAYDKDNRYGFIDKTGEFHRLPGKVSGVEGYNTTHFVFKENGNYGVMTMDFDNPETVIRAKYEHILLLADGRFLVYDDKFESSIFNKKGDKDFEFDDDYRFVMPVNGKKFKYLTREGSHYILLDDKGKPVNKNEYDEFSIIGSIKDIESQYVNVDQIVADVTESLTKNGFGQYYVGEPVSNLGGQPKDYYSSYWRGSNKEFTDKSLNKSGYNYEIEFKGTASGAIAKHDWWTSSYSFNSDVIVTSLELNVTVSSDVWPLIKYKLRDAIKAKGFISDYDGEITGDYMLFGEDGICVFVTSTSVGFIVEVANEVDPTVDYE